MAALVLVATRAPADAITWSSHERTRHEEERAMAPLCLHGEDPSAHAPLSRLQGDANAIADGGWPVTGGDT